MAISFNPLDWFKKSEPSAAVIKSEQPEVIVEKAKADFYSSGGGTWRPLFAISFNGEKNLGEIGPIKKYILDYEALRLRSWQSYIESEITQTVINKFILWIVGSGLKLQSEPAVNILKGEGITIDKEAFSKEIEERFSLYASSPESGHTGMKGVDALAPDVEKNALLGGDVLCVLRLTEDNRITTQIIDATHVQSPMYGTDIYPQNLANGNRIMNGVEVSPTGEHVAFYVRKPIPNSITYERIVAKGEESGLVMAFLVYGSEYRIDNVRGMPLIAVILETLKKLERYKEATVGSAEERQKIAYFITHKQGSTGANPLAKQLAKAFDADRGSADSDLPATIQGQQLANQVAATTNKMAFNMPIDSEIKTTEAKNELYFKDFYDVNFDVVCGSIMIPPDIARSMYNSNYSASRAAIKDWEHVVNVKRSDFARQYYQKVYNFYFEVNVYLFKIQARGFLQARLTGNWIVIRAYMKARWMGVNVPHIDPVKEVEAVRMKLGPAGAHFPLMTAEQATESLGSGEFTAIAEQFASESEKVDTLGIEIPVPEIAIDPNKTPPGKEGKE